MIDYATYCEIHRCTKKNSRLGKSHANSNSPTGPSVSGSNQSSSWNGFRCCGPANWILGKARSSLAHLHCYSAQQICFQQLSVRGYQGSRAATASSNVSCTRFGPSREPVSDPAVCPGECAQVDWGSAGLMPVGSTRRRVSFFVMVLCYSRRLYG